MFMKYVVFAANRSSLVRPVVIDDAPSAAFLNPAVRSGSDSLLDVVESVALTVPPPVRVRPNAARQSTSHTPIGTTIWIAPGLYQVPFVGLFWLRSVESVR